MNSFNVIRQGRPGPCHCHTASSPARHDSAETASSPRAAPIFTGDNCYIVGPLWEGMAIQRQSISFISCSEPDKPDKPDPRHAPGNGAGYSFPSIGFVRGARSRIDPRFLLGGPGKLHTNRYAQEGRRDGRGIIAWAFVLAVEQNFQLIL